ncbi:MAG: tyrosine-protein phosphatase, partial [Tepidiformaceae bacterium]
LPRMAERGVTEEMAMRLMASDAPDMASTLTMLRERWGSAEGYLADHAGVSHGAIEAVRARMVA